MRNMFVLAAVLAAAVMVSGCIIGSTDNPPLIFAECNEMNVAEAEIIAEETCGPVNGRGTCNEITKTWWFDANITKSGCYPACVVNTTSETAEINWRCTGLVDPRVLGNDKEQCDNDSDCNIWFDHCSCSNICIRADAELADCAMVCSEAQTDTSTKSCGCLNSVCTPK